MNKKKQRVGTLFSECEALKKLAEDEKRDLTPEELIAINGKMDEIDALNLAINTEERMAKFSPQSKETEPGPKSFQGDVDVEAKPVYRSLGQQILDVVNHGMNRLDSRGLERLASVMGPPETRSASGMNITTPSEGGFLVQPDYASELMMPVYENGILYSRAGRLPITGNSISVPYVDETSRATGSRWGGIRTYRAAEAAQYTGSKATVGRWELKLEKLIAICYLTDEVMEDATAMESIVRTAFPKEFDFRLNDEIIRGTGAGQMLGIVNAPCTVPVAKEAGQAADTINSENILKMDARMPEEYSGESIWLINKELKPQLPKLSITIGTSGYPIYLPPGGISGAQYGTLLGRPVFTMPQCSKPGDVGDIILCAMSEYGIIEKGGLKVAESMHLRFDYGEMALRFTMRNNGMPKWKSARTPYKGANDESPFVVLAAR